MLTTLRISGFAVVEEVEVAFRPGLNVLTGETGAGKSVLLEALHLVLGGRMSAEVLREGADEAVVEALFELPPGHPVFGRLRAGGIPVAEEATEVLVRRAASRGGRGRASVNGALCTVSMLESALRGLVDVTGQHAHVALLDEATHLALLDAYAARGQDGPSSTLARYRRAYESLAGLVREQERLRLDGDERARRADYLAYQLRELEAAKPRHGEDGELERERQVLASAERLRGAASSAEALVYGGEGSAAESLGRAVRMLGDAAVLDPRLEPVVTLLRSALAEAEEAGRSLARYEDEASGDPARLLEVEERLDALRALSRKHGGSLEAALARAGTMRAELAALSGGEERLLALDGEIEEAGALALALAGELTRARSEAARLLAGEVREELERLAMGRCRVELSFLPPESPIVQGGVALGPDGAERAQILLGPNPGEPARPLARIASGGELSRVLLAVKRALARVDPVETYVFDEVDAGIGGGVAEAVGRLLSHVSAERQVICVTHLPQVAAFADRHLSVWKSVEGGRTSTGVTPLESPAERTAEVARMLAGVELTSSALEHAGALIRAARAPVREENSRRAPGPGDAGLAESARGRPPGPVRGVVRRIGAGASGSRARVSEHRRGRGSRGRREGSL